MRIAILSDMHFCSGLGTERENDSYEAFAEAIEKTSDCDLILLGGDLFDTKNPTNEAFVKAMEIMVSPLLLQNDIKLVQGLGKDISKISEIALMGTPIVAIHGNHERRAKGLLNPVEALEKAGFLTYLHCNGVVFEKEGERVAIHGISGVPDQYSESVLGNWDPKPEHGTFNIFLMHQSVKEFMYAPNTIELAKIPKGFDVYINGHIHEAEIGEHDGKPFLITGSLVPTQLKAESEKPKGFWIIDTSVRDITRDVKPRPAKTVEKGDVTIHWIELDNQRKMYYREYKKPNVKDVEIELQKIVSESDGKKPLIRVSLKGEVSDTFVSELETKFGDKALLSFKKEKTEKDLPTKTLEEHKLSVEEMGRKILLSNLKNAGLSEKKFEDIFELLVEGKTDDVMVNLLSMPTVKKTEKEEKHSKKLQKKHQQSKLFGKVGKLN
ncbi:MAG: DNA repair exonuclease [Candidatus Aenigmarchaeota archaeon]|nr:DNA repair exonuclease [Candidatus Aenigmarchaeota archaeon]